jgi:hypothetical protein
LKKDLYDQVTSQQISKLNFDQLLQTYKNKLGKLEHKKKHNHATQDDYDQDSVKKTSQEGEGFGFARSKAKRKTFASNTSNLFDQTRCDGNPKKKLKNSHRMQHIEEEETVLMETKTKRTIKRVNSLTENYDDRSNDNFKDEKTMDFENCSEKDENQNEIYCNPEENCTSDDEAKDITSNHTPNKNNPIKEEEMPTKSSVTYNVEDM